MAKISTAQDRGGEKACKKQMKNNKQKNMSSELTGGLFLRSELNEHRV